MPCGRFVNGTFDITVTFDYNASTHERFTEWPRSLNKAAELFFHATEGQLRIGRWLIANRSYGLEAAEIVLHEQGETSYASAGGFGSQQSFPSIPLLQVHLAPSVKLNPMVIVHELAHQIFAVLDEYTGAIDTDIIAASPAASTTLIPIDNPARADNALVGQYVGLRKGALLERRLIASSTASAVVVSQPFSFPANESTSPTVFYQDPTATCHEGNGANADGYLCLMQESSNVGTFDNNGIWTPYTGNAPSTDFCSQHNHDLIPGTDILDGDTNQHVINQQSCWAGIADSMAQRYGYPLDAPDPPSLTPTGWSASLLPEITHLAEERRLALVIDRSGSMGESSKWQNALFAANYWVDRVRTDAQLGGQDIRLAVISYNHSAQTHLPLTDGASLPANNNTLFDGLSPSGWTNMRAAMNTARGLLVPDPSDRAATQAMVLLTDGVHNYPDGTEFATDTVATDSDIMALAEAGVRVMSLGFGEPDDAIDMPVLEAIGKATCGSIPFQAANANAAEILTEQLYELLMGGLAAADNASMPSSPSTPLDLAQDTPVKSRPPLEKLLDGFQIKLETLVDASAQPSSNARNPPIWRSRFHVVRAWVEQGAERASFTLRHPIKQPLWLYLIDPDNQSFALDDNAGRHVIGDTYTYTAIGKPKPGLWRMVAVRPTAGEVIDFHAFCGIAHRQLVADAAVSTDNNCGAPVMISAAAVWGDRLSGLQVQATITAPNGQQSTLILNDIEQDEPTGSGSYRGYFQPSIDGRYHGQLRISGPQNPSPAQLIHRINHVHIGAAANKVESIEIKTKASRFVRIVPFSFWSGERPKVKDKDRRR